MNSPLATPTALVRVLLVEDNDNDAELVKWTLGFAGFPTEIVRVQDAEGFVAGLATKPDVIIADYSLPKFSAHAALALVQAQGIDIPFIVVSGSVGDERIVELVRSGAHDCLQKDRLTRLVPAIQRELAQAQLRANQRSADARVQAMAYTDGATGLGNRNWLEEQLILAIRAQQGFRLVLVGLERWIDVLHTLGRGVAEEMARSLAARLRLLAGGPVVVRSADDEFGILVPGSDGRDDATLANDLFAALHHQAILADIPFDLRVRLGLVAAPEHGDTVAVLLRKGAVALHRARSTERAWFRYDVDDDPWSPRRLVLLNDLHNAGARGELYLAYQPRIRLSDRRMIGVEALIRWQHPTFGFVGPDQFIPFAEQTGLIHALTEWVFERAAAQAAAWRAAGRTMAVGVNISGRSLLEIDLPERMSRLLADYQLPPDALDLELTESALVEDPARARATLTTLKDRGIRVFLDDFGTGYSSLNYLRALPLYALKIDKSFVMGGLSHPDDVSIVVSTIMLAHNLGLSVVAEGVESPEALSRLASLRCDEAQGYYFSKPVPAPGLAAWMDASAYGGMAASANNSPAA